MNRERTAQKRRAESVHETPPPKGTFKRSVWDQVSTLTTPGFVYFVQAEIGGLVKIGWATKPAERVRNMQRWCPVKLAIMFSVPGDGKMEAELHRRFKSARQHGEWFEPVPEIFALIEEWRATPPPIPVWPEKRRPTPPPEPKPKKKPPAMKPISTEGWKRIMAALE